MSKYETREQKIAKWVGPLEDEDGLCLRHGQIMLLEPCHKCIQEVWDDKEHELKRLQDLLTRSNIYRDALNRIEDGEENPREIAREALDQ